MDKIMSKDSRLRSANHFFASDDVDERSEAFLPEYDLFYGGGEISEAKMESLKSELAECRKMG